MVHSFITNEALTTVSQWYNYYTRYGGKNSDQLSFKCGFHIYI